MVLAFSLATAAVLFLNPRGPQLILDTLAMSRHPNVLAMDEWQPLFPGRIQAVHWIYLASLALVAVAQLSSRRRLTFAQFVVLAAFGVAPLFHQRLVIWWL